MKVVVGLGNPGPRYEGTRHNVGFAVVDELARSPRVGPFRSKFESLLAEWTEWAEPVVLVKPQTFMNLSGRAVRAIIDFYKLEVSALLVLSDDINLPLGRLRARASGSHGGHNGLRNIQDQLGTTEYARLRIGVGAPPEDECVDHVLSRFKPGERPVMEEAIRKAVDAVVLWATRDIAAAMNAINGSESRASSKKPKSEEGP